MNLLTENNDRATRLFGFLEALKQLTQAVSFNFSSKALFEIYSYLAQEQLEGKRVLVFLGEEGARIRKSNEKDHELLLKKVPPHLEGISNCTVLGPEIPSYNIAVPVLHKDKLIGLTLIGFDDERPELSTDELSFLQTLSNILVYANENKQLFKDKIKQEKVKSELQLAGKIQERLIPKVLPQANKLSFYGKYRPHSEVGGDYYDILDLKNGKYLLCVADVSGKGIPAALLMSNFQALLHVLVRFETDLSSIVYELNRMVGKTTEGEHFIAAFFAMIDETSGKIETINAGLVAPVLINAKDEKIRIKTNCPPLGVLPKLKDQLAQSSTLNSGDVLLAFTDGLSEGVSSQVALFDRKLESIKGLSAVVNADSAVQLFLDELQATELEELIVNDDLTLVGLRYHA